MQTMVVVVVVGERGGRSCRGEMLAAGVPVCLCLLILYDAIRKAVRASERSPRSTRSTVYPGEKIKKISLIIFGLKVKGQNLSTKGKLV